MMDESLIEVLLVEDNLADALLLREILDEVTSTRFELAHVERLNEALKRLDEERFDVVLLDLSLPDERGLETFVRTNTQAPDVPILVLTGLDDEVLALEAVREGAQDYLIKGKVDSDLLTRAIRYAIERKRAQKTLRSYAELLEERVRERTIQVQNQYARLETILRSTSDGIVVTDGEGEIIQANPVAHTWLTQTLSPQDAATLREVVRDLAQRAEERPEETLEFAGLDLQLSAEPVEVMEGAAVVAIHDRSSLRALERMRSRLVTNISHELRTPVTTIKLYTALMRRTPRENWDEYLDILEQEVEWQARLVEDVLQMAQIDARRLELEPKPTSLNELTAAVVAEYQETVQNQALTLEHQPAEPGPVALVDPQQIMQVLHSLVLNAILYTPEGGRIAVSTGKKETKGHVWATMTVADTGVGIPEDELPHVFEHFFRGDKPRSMQISGTGLGLSIAKGIAEMHGGQMTVQSQAGVGSAFTVWLPLASQ
jgi:signal transduction histidine kinase